ncbi:methyltransferase domain-containing protein [Streptomyces sp. SID5477]|nr:methyltransferase domain-containing protein [Streptomyces sp. SID5477]
MGDGGWEWDETLFSGTAPFYRRGRLPYAPGLARVLAQVLELDGRGRLLDLGCGPGTVALGLAGLFDEVVGVDPDAGMLAAAAREAAELEVTEKVRWVRARAEELPAGLGDFTVATLGGVVWILPGARGLARTSAALSSVARAPPCRPPPPCICTHQTPLR